MGLCMIKINSSCIWLNSRKWSIHIVFSFQMSKCSKNLEIWWKYPHYQRPSRCQKSKPAKPLLWNQKLIQEGMWEVIRRDAIPIIFFRNLIAMMYRKTSKWINTIGYTNKNINNINTNKRMKTNIKLVTQHSNTYTNIILHKT